MLLARTLLSPEEPLTWVRVLNYGLTNCTVHQGELLASAEPVESVEGQSVKVSACSEETYQHVQCLINELPGELSDDEK
jgi:hypothetical protein